MSAVPFALSVRPDPAGCFPPLLSWSLLAVAAWWFTSHRGERRGRRLSHRRRSSAARSAPRFPRPARSAPPRRSKSAPRSRARSQSVEVDFNDTVRQGQVIARHRPEHVAGAARPGLGLAGEHARRPERSAGRGPQRRSSITRASPSWSSASWSRAPTPTWRAPRATRPARASLRRTAQVRQQQASVDSARLDLEKTVIRSPVDGVVLLRAVEPGPDRGREPADAGAVQDRRRPAQDGDRAGDRRSRHRPGARGPAGALHRRRVSRSAISSGRVKQVRLAATNTANVITYPVVVEVDNPGADAAAGHDRQRRDRDQPQDRTCSACRTRRCASVRRKRARQRRWRTRLRRRAGQSESRRRRRAAAAQARAARACRKRSRRSPRTLQLDARQQAAFDEAIADDARAQRADAREAQQAAASPAAGAGIPAWAAAAAWRRPAQRRRQSAATVAARMAERMKQSFAGFRATLRAGAAAASWDAELAALTSGQARTGVQAGRRQARAGDRAHRRHRRHAHRSARRRAQAKATLVIVGSARPEAP